MREEQMAKTLGRYAGRAAGRFGQDVNVSCAGGVVTLDGRVASRTHAIAIAGLIGATDGVTAVVDRLRVTVPALRPAM